PPRAPRKPAPTVTSARIAPPIASERVVEAHVDRGPFPAIRDLDVTHDIRWRQPPKTHPCPDLEARVHELFRRVEHLADVHERRDLELRVHAKDAHAEHL